MLAFHSRSSNSLHAPKVIQSFLQFFPLCSAIVFIMSLRYKDLSGGPSWLSHGQHIKFSPFPRLHNVLFLKYRMNYLGGKMEFAKSADSSVIFTLGWTESQISYTLVMSAPTSVFMCSGCNVVLAVSLCLLNILHESCAAHNFRDSSLALKWPSL